MQTPETTAAVEFAGPLRGSGNPLEVAVLGALDRLEGALTLKPLGDDRFEAGNEACRFGRLFGGQLIAQAMAGAAATVEGLDPHSIHASFLRPGSSEKPVRIVVDRTRDGRSMSVRRVAVEQDGHTLLTATVSFDNNPETPETPTAPDGDGHAAGPAPESVPLLQHWARQAPTALAVGASTWIDIPPPLEMRIGEAPTFLGGPRGTGQRAHWMRLPRAVDGARMNAALLAYASDYLLLDMAFRDHPDRVDHTTHVGLTLDHSVWLHRPVRFDDWHLYTQQTVAVGGHRALVTGSIVDVRGRRVASTSQEVLVRPIAAPRPAPAADQEDRS